MKVEKTERGFSIVEFIDLYGKQCSLQESSLATDDAIWLGRNGQRMHLTRHMVKELIPKMKLFVETGEIV